MGLDESLRPFPRAESFLSSRADDDLPCLELADRVSDLIGVALEDITLPRLDGEPDSLWEQRRAVMYLGILGARSIRGQMWLQRLGYDAEAYVFQRRLIEIESRMGRILDPVNGPQRANEWLRGGDSKPSKVVDIPQWFWNSLSHTAHADYRAVHQHLVRERSDGLHDFLILPYRSIDRGNAALVQSAGRGLGIVLHIKGFTGREEIEGMPQFLLDLQAASDKWLSDPSRDAGTSDVAP